LKSQISQRSVITIRRSGISDVLTGKEWNSGFSFKADLIIKTHHEENRPFKGREG